MKKLLQAPYSLTFASYFAASPTEYLVTSKGKKKPAASSSCVKKYNKIATFSFLFFSIKLPIYSNSLSNKKRSRRRSLGHQFLFELRRRAREKEGGKERASERLNNGRLRAPTVKERGERGRAKRRSLSSIIRLIGKYSL